MQQPFECWSSCKRLLLVYSTLITCDIGEINAVHPFREGNGRVQRVFCSQLALNAGYFIDFESVDQEQMYAVMVASFNGDASPLVALLNEITAIVEP